MLDVIKLIKSFILKIVYLVNVLAETLVDPETGEIIAEKGTVLDRRTLDRIIPYLEKDIGFKTYQPIRWSS